MSDPGRFAVPPFEQRRLRDACASGDIEAVLNLLSPEESCLTSPVGKMLKKHYHCEPRIPALDFVYEDDRRNSIVHYLAGAKNPTSGMEMLLRWVFRLFGGRLLASRFDEGRAAIFQELVQSGYDVDLSLQNSKNQGVLHFCVNTNSVHVMRAVLQTAFSEGFPIDKRPDVHLEDAEHRTPLGQALALRGFKCVKLLVAAGALDGLLPPISFCTSHRIVTNAAAEQSMPFLAAVTKRIRDPLKRSERRVKALENELCSSGNEAQGMALNVLKNDQDVERELYTSLESVATQTGLDPSSALTLLSDHQYDLQSALESHKKSRKMTLKVEEGEECIVCFDPVSDLTRSVIMPCGHVTCDECWKGILKARLDDGDVHMTVCPFQGCSCHFPLQSLMSMLAPKDQNQFMKLFCSRYVDIKKDTKWCPQHSCGCALTLTRPHAVTPNSVISVKCQCSFTFCWNCSREGHEPASCKQVEEWVKVLDVVQTEKKSTDWVRKETVPCPRCHTPIERNGGCNHMGCSICKQQFCYQCGRRWKGHEDHYSCVRTRPVPNERVKTVTMWSVIEGYLNKLKPTVNRVSYEWHLRHYLEHDLDVQQFTSIANYMTNLLVMTLPTEELRKTNGKYRSLQVDVGYIQRWLEQLLAAERVLKNSYIQSFSLRTNSTRRKFLSRLQDQLADAVRKLKATFTSIPGFREIPRNVKISTNNVKFTEKNEIFHDQFLYCHAVHHCRNEIEFTSRTVHRMQEDIVRASRLGLTCHRRPFQQKLP